VLDYIRDAAEIYRQSFAAIRAEADLTTFPDDVARVVVRLIHTCGQVDVADHVAYTDDVVRRVSAALNGGAPVLCDSSMVAAGITTARLPAGNQVVTLVADPRAAEGAAPPVAVLGGPVGFVGSAQSKQELIDRPRGMSYLVVRGRRGGSAMAAAAVNAIASDAE